MGFKKVVDGVNHSLVTLKTEHLSTLTNNLDLLYGVLKKLEKASKVHMLLPLLFRRTMLLHMGF
jgi:hypothetical protein